MKVIIIILLILAYLAIGFGVWFIFSLVDSVKYDSSPDEELLFIILIFWPVLLIFFLPAILSEVASDLVENVAEDIKNRRDKE